MSLDRGRSFSACLYRPRGKRSLHKLYKPNCDVICLASTLGWLVKGSVGPARSQIISIANKNAAIVTHAIAAADRTIVGLAIVLLQRLHHLRRRSIRLVTTLFPVAGSVSTVVRLMPCDANLFNGHVCSAVTVDLFRPFDAEIDLVADALSTQSGRTGTRANIGAGIPSLSNGQIGTDCSRYDHQATAISVQLKGGLGASRLEVTGDFYGAGVCPNLHGATARPTS